jgi:hypothetical protein
MPVSHFLAQVSHLTELVTVVACQRQRKAFANVGQESLAENWRALPGAKSSRQAALRAHAPKGSTWQFAYDERDDCARRRGYVMWCGLNLSIRCARNDLK